VGSPKDECSKEEATRRFGAPCGLGGRRLGRGQLRRACLRAAQCAPLIAPYALIIKFPDTLTSRCQFDFLLWAVLAG